MLFWKICFYKLKGVNILKLLSSDYIYSDYKYLAWKKHPVEIDGTEYIND